ncbi:hypothetical protein D3C77_456870 [compost metagenome]
MYARFSVNFLSANDLVESLRRPICPAIAISINLLQLASLYIKQYIIYSPSINPQKAIFDSILFSLLQSFNNLIKKVINIPIIMSILVAKTITIAMNFAKFKLFLMKLRLNEPAAGSSNINSNIIFQ